MPSQAFTIVDDALLTSPAYDSLGDKAARILVHVVACVKRSFRQGRLDEVALGWIDFPRARLPFPSNPRTFARALGALEQAGFIEVHRSPGRPHMIAMSRKWRSNGQSAHYCNTLVRSTRVSPSPPSDSPLKSSNQIHTIQKGDVDGVQLTVDPKTPEEPERPPTVNLYALCRSLGDVAGQWGRNVVRRSIAGKPRGLIVRAYKSVMASKGVKCRAALFIHRLEHGWLSPEVRAKATYRSSCDEPVHVGAIAQRLARQMASATCQKSVEQHAYNTLAPPVQHRDLTGRSPGPHRQVTRTSR